MEFEIEGDKIRVKRRVASLALKIIQNCTKSVTIGYEIGKSWFKWCLSLKVAIWKVLYIEKFNKSDKIGQKSDEIGLKIDLSNMEMLDLYDKCDFGKKYDFLNFSQFGVKN